MRKPTMQEKYDALPPKGRAIVDAVVNAPAVDRVPLWNRLCEEHKITIGEGCALRDIIADRIKVTP